MEVDGAIFAHRFYERHRNCTEEHNGEFIKKRDKNLGAALSFVSVVSMSHLRPNLNDTSSAFLVHGTDGAAFRNTSALSRWDLVA